MLVDLIIGLLVGGVAGFGAGKIMDSNGNGVIANILLGVFGGVLSGIVFGLLGIGTKGIVGNFIFSVVGACALIAIWRKVLKK